jgi:SAM-dependent methyltransferase
MPALDAELRLLMQGGAKRICDVGGGANPVAAAADIDRLGVDYFVLDAARRELDKAPPTYETVVMDIDDRAAVDWLVNRHGAFDAVISRWTAEHVRRGRRFHEHVHRLLRPAGTAVHLFPTLYSPVFMLNRVLPPPIAAAVVPHVDKSGREPAGRHAAFHPYYSWCRGPTRRQIDRLASIGFWVRRYVGFFGHPYYERVKPLRLMHQELSSWLVRHPVPALTSYALVVLERDCRGGP